MSNMLLIDSVGIELETEDVHAQKVRRPNGFQVKRDASCEKESLSWNNMRLSFEPPELIKDLCIKNIGKQVFGTELVSGIIDTSQPYLSILKELTSNLCLLGESAQSYRAGFHVHVNTPMNLRVLKSILRICRHLEQVMFMVGTMGYDYRGKQNDSTYCRPLTKYGPVCVETRNGNFAQVFTITDLLKCDTVEEFKLKYGDLTNLLGAVHYVPVRYHAVNLVPMWTQGSLEFRVFNKSLNPYYLMAAIEFSKLIAGYAIRSSFESLKEDGILGDKRENSVFDITGEDDRTKIIDTFLNFIEITGYSNGDVIAILMEILKSGDINSLVLPQTYIHSHLRFHAQGNKCPAHWRSGAWSPARISESVIQRPTFLDIHNLRSPSMEMPRERSSERPSGSAPSLGSVSRRFVESMEDLRTRTVTSRPVPNRWEFDSIDFRDHTTVTLGNTSGLSFEPHILNSSYAVVDVRLDNDAFMPDPGFDEPDDIDEEEEIEIEFDEEDDERDNDENPW